ncbi:MAG TPA: prolyl oligopeptidase family serine peptidase [Anaeromyxobacteraceae bacterium]|nr:prolyl oligopeptidase family serine peptidase [Anaeromyxobacteraceae bacterium]
MIAAFLLLAIGASDAQSTPQTPPAAQKRPVTREYHGVKVVDDYDWLEKDDAAVRAWSDAQNAAARAFLDHIPGRQSLSKRVGQLVRSSGTRYFGLSDHEGVIVAGRSDPAKKQAELVRLPSAEAPEAAQIILDPNAMDPSGHTAIDFWSVSLNGKLVAVSLSRNGSEDGDLHVYDVATGKEIDGVIPHVNNGTAGGSVAWNTDGSGFVYTRYPRGNERPPEDAGFYQQIWFHKLGTPTEQDVYELGKDFPRIAEIALESTRDGRYVLAQVKNGDGGEAAFWLRAATGGWRQLSRFEDQVVEGRTGWDGAAYLLSRAGAPKGKILRVDLAKPSLEKAQVVVPEGDGAILGFVPTSKALYVVDLLGGPGRIRMFPLGGGEPREVRVPEVATIHEADPMQNGDVLFEVVTYLKPPAFYRTDASGTGLVPTKLAMTSVADYSDCEVVRVYARSKDGTRVPVNVIRRKGIRLDGRNPTILWGYGGYGASETPNFSTTRRAWMDVGGVYAVANIRGGGEYGDAWHRAGNLTRKQNVFDDFFAAAELLGAQGYADKEHLAIMGGSNGGLLMGAELTQHPSSFKAVVSAVGIYDMLRVEGTPNGAFNVTEFGTVKDLEQFKALYAYSPYHHVVDGQAYPAVLFLTGANDPRVDPWHSRKMVARLQAANSAKTPVLLRTSSSSGHGIGSSLDEIIAERVDMYGFVMAVMGIDYDRYAPR